MKINIFLIVFYATAYGSFPSLAFADSNGADHLKNPNACDQLAAELATILPVGGYANQYGGQIQRFEITASSHPNGDLARCYVDGGGPLQDDPEYKTALRKSIETGHPQTLSFDYYCDLYADDLSPMPKTWGGKWNLGFGSVFILPNIYGCTVSKEIDKLVSGEAMHFTTDGSFIILYAGDSEK